MVVPYMSRSSSAWSMTARTSFTPAVIAESSTNLRPGARAITCARVVLPVPGGPYKITEDGPAGPAFSPANTRRGEPGVSRCSWPRTSSMVRGRIRTARGARDAERAERARGIEAREEAGSSAGAPIRLTRSPSSGSSRSKRESAIVLLYRFKGLRRARGVDLQAWI